MHFFRGWQVAVSAQLGLHLCPWKILKCGKSLKKKYLQKDPHPGEKMSCVVVSMGARAKPLQRWKGQGREMVPVPSEAPDCFCVICPSHLSYLFGLILMSNARAQERWQNSFTERNSLWSSLKLLSLPMCPWEMYGGDLPPNTSYWLEAVGTDKTRRTMAALFHFGMCSNKSTFPTCRQSSFNVCDATSLQCHQPCQVESNGPTNLLNCPVLGLRAGLEWVQNPARYLASLLPLWQWWWWGEVSHVHKNAQMDPALFETWTIFWKGDPTWEPPTECFGRIIETFCLEQTLKLIESNC